MAQTRYPRDSNDMPSAKCLLPRCAQCPLEGLRDLRCWRLLTSRRLQYANIIFGPFVALRSLCHNYSSDWGGLPSTIGFGSPNVMSSFRRARPILRKAQHVVNPVLQVRSFPRG
jgi:hypothetical protein